MITEIDVHLMNWIQANLRSDVMDNIMKFITLIGDWMGIWAALLCIYFYIKKDKRKSMQIAVSLILTMLLNQVLLKNLIRRPRPFITNSHLSSLIQEPGSYSFPSSHSASSFSAASAMSKVNKWITIFGYTLAILIAFSRVYLNVHYPSDVLVGAIIGITATKIAIFSINYFQKKID